MKKEITKRSISILMTVILVFGMVATALPAGLFSTTTQADVTYNPDKAGACILPAQAYSGSTYDFMTNYVYKNASYSLNSNFKARSWSGNLNPGLSENQGLDMSKYTKKNHDSLWSATWRYTPNQVMKNLMSKGQIKLGYHVNLYNDKHSNGKRHWSKEWGKAMIRLSGSSQGQLDYRETKNENDEQAQLVENLITVKSNEYFDYWAGNNRCVCNGSCVGSSVIYAVDDGYPKVVKSYISKSKNGSAVSSATDGFHGNETGYLILECSESIRFADNKTSDLRLELKAYSKKTGNQAGTITAQLVELEGNKLIFKFTTPSVMDGVATDVKITRYEMPQSSDYKWSNGKYSAVLLDANGNSATYSGFKLTASSKVTDLAGNGLLWQDDDISNYVYMDNVKAEVQKVNLKTARVTRTNISMDGDDGDVSRTNLFTAPGDKLEFTVTFNDRIKYDTSQYSSDSDFLDSVTATLNVKDSSGKNVTIKAKSMKPVDANTVDSKKALGQKTKITFEDFKITSDMYQEGGESIKIIALNGMDGVTDICGNELQNEDNVTLAPDVEQFIDRLSPSASLGLTMKSDVYSPISTDKGKVMTFPISIKDAKESTDSKGKYVSGVSGILANFKWVCGSGNESYAYEYCWSTESSVPADAKWSTLWTATDASDTNRNKNGSFTEYDSVYLHIRLKDGVTYGADTDTAKGKVSGTLVIETTDYAGNKGTDTFAISHMADNEAPTLVNKGSSIGGNATRTQADITTNIKVADEYGIQSVTYEWSGKGTQQYDMTRVTNRRSFDISLSESFYDSDSDVLNDQKTVTLKVTVTDYAGHPITETYTYDLYFGKIENRYFLDAGTASEPVTVPVLKMNKQDDIVNADETTSELLSYAEVEFEDGSCYLYICDSKVEQDIFTQSGWYYVSSKSTDTVDSGTKLTYVISGSEGDQTAKESLQQHIGQCYGTGEMTITIRTADQFNDLSKTDGKLEITYESEDAIAVDTHTDIYIAREGNYSVSVGSITDNTGDDMKSLLAYNKDTSEQTVYSLDGVSFLYSLSGEKESRFNYNFADIDIAGSYVALVKIGDEKHTAVMADNDDNSDLECERFGMEAVREQGITISSDISERYGTGWYYLKFVVTTTDGDQYVSYYNDIYLDRYVYTDFTSGVYNKIYSKTMEHRGEQKNVSIATAEDMDTSFYSSWGETLGIGIAPAPDGFTVSQQLTFTGSAVEKAMVGRKLKFRVYNQADTEYEKNVVWHDMTNQSDKFAWIYNIQEAKTDEDGKYVFDASSYKEGDTNYLPLTDGMNVICYEVQNMNGETTKKTLYLNTTKATILKDYEKEHSDIEEKWSLSDTVLADNPSAVVELYDFYDYDIDHVYSYGREITAFDSGSWEFALYSERGYSDIPSEYNDNLVVDVMTVEDVDGVAPIISDVEYQQDGMNFCYKFTITDNNELDTDNLIQLNYDYMYAYKLRMANDTMPEVSEDPDAQVPTSSFIPENVAIDYNVPFRVNEEPGNVGIWTDYTAKNYGIYQTQIIRDEDPSKAYVCLWGSYMYQEDVAEGEECSTEIDLDIFDANGNSGYEGQYLSYVNQKPSLELKGSYIQNSMQQNSGNLYTYDNTTCLDAQGNLLAECAVPLSRIQNYGAGTNLVAISEISGSPVTGDTNGELTDDGSGMEVTPSTAYRYHFLSTVPMIRNAGLYEMEFMDIFGNEYVQDWDTTSAFEEGSDRIKINYSETKVTNQNVTVMANLVAPSGEAIAADAELTSISAVFTDENGNSSTITGEIDMIDSTAARIVMEKNGVVNIQGIYGGQHVSKSVKVSNIDKKIEEVKPVFLYGDGVTEPNFMEGSEDTVDGSVKVILYCEEDLYGINGDTEYTFPVGSKKGDTYTFEYRDEAGNTATTTVTLPYNVDKTVLPIPDTTAPEFSGIISGLRHSYTALDGIFDYDSDGNTGETARANELMAAYTARGYRMSFQITDESKVKLIAKTAGAKAPESYSDKSDSIDGLKIIGYTVEITKPAQFDLYFVDEADNVKALKGFNVNSFDFEVADVEVKYQVLRDDNDVAFVRAYLMADEKEEVMAMNSDATTFMNEETVTQAGVETTKLVKRYYHDFFENESYVFTFMDVYGNTGIAEAEVKGFDYAAPTQLSVQWFGTSRRTGEGNSSAVMNEAPDTEGLAFVNHDVTAKISYNKAISGVRLYAYDETQENGLGTELTSAEAVHAEYVGRKVTVTYENNCNQKVVVAVQAKNSGKKTYTVLPAVQCIDKQAPSVVVSQGVLSKDKQNMTYTITTDEEAFLNNGTQLAVEHMYTAYENGEHAIRVMDDAGNVATYNISVTQIDDTRLELMFGLRADGSDLTADIESLNIKTGDTLYVKASKEAQIVLGESALHLMAGDMGSIQLSADAGMYIMHAADVSTGKEQTYKVLMVFRDQSAPMITFDTNVISFPVETDKEIIDAALRSGITIEDNKDGFIDPSNAVITGIPEKWNKGIHVITYEASDSEGNKSSVTRKVYLYEEGTPNIQVNGKDAIPYGITVVDSSIIHVKGTNLTSGGLLMKYRSGIKSAAQMKYGTTGTMLKGIAKDEEQTFILPKRSGFYTLYVRTQDRKEQLTYVYVNLSE